MPPVATTTPAYPPAPRAELSFHDPSPRTTHALRPHCCGTRNIRSRATTAAPQPSDNRSPDVPASARKSPARKPTDTLGESPSATLQLRGAVTREAHHCIELRRVLSGDARILESASRGCSIPAPAKSIARFTAQIQTHCAVVRPGARIDSR